MKYAVFFLWLLSTTYLNAQNLVPNGDFEEDVICAEFNLICGPFGWRLTSSDPPDYYNGPVNDEDTGKITHWTSFVPFSYDNQGIYRESLQTPLLCPLEKGAAYLLSFQVKAKEVAVKEIDVMFMSSVTITASNQALAMSPRIKLRNELYWYDKHDEWIQLWARYIADGTERYMLIGNFQPQLLTEHKRIYNTHRDHNLAIYYIDNVLLKPEKGTFCDEAPYLSLLHADRRRHSLSPELFFPVYPPQIIDSLYFDSIKIATGTPVILKNIFFDVDRFELLPLSYKELDKLVRFLKQQPELKIEISGHTDITGNEAHNMELSVNRAEAVAHFLESNGIQTSRIISKGFASTRPVQTNDSPEGRQANRRVEFILKKYFD